jgi:hypothetical protein
MRDLSQCLVAGIAALAVNAATFDALGFPMAAGVIFLLIGATGALWAIHVRAAPLVESQTPTPTSSSAPQNVPGASARTVLLRSAVGLLVVGVLVSFIDIHGAKPSYQAQATVIAAPAADAGSVNYLNSQDLKYAVSALRDVMMSQRERETLAARGAPNYEVAFDDGSLVMGTDNIGNLSATLHLIVDAPDRQSATVALNAVINETDNEFQTMQTRSGVTADLLVPMTLLQAQTAYPVYGRPSRAYAGLVVIALLLSIALYQLFGRRRRFGDTLAAGDSYVEDRPLVHLSSV